MNADIFGDYTLAAEGRTFVLTAENPTGAKGGGSHGSDIDKVRPCLALAPGETAVLADIDGPGTVDHIWVTGDIDSHMAIRIFYEHESVPSAEAPLSAFFGYPFGGTVRDVFGRFPSLDSALLHVAPFRSCCSFFRMPFRKHIKITVENRSAFRTSTLYYAVSGVSAPVPEDALYFHACYRQSLPLERGKAHVIADGIRGKGRFLGVTLGAGVNAPNGCWVEGEAKMYIDGDEYPSINYTGTEDYFCGAYAFGYDSPLQSYQSYSHLYAGTYSIAGGEFKDRSGGKYNVQPRFMAYRWHLPDPILFERDFRMTLLNMGIAKDGTTFGRRDDFATVAYWYQTHPFAPLPPLPADRDITLD